MVQYLEDLNDSSRFLGRVFRLEHGFVLVGVEGFSYRIDFFKSMGFESLQCSTRAKTVKRVMTHLEPNNSVCSPANMRLMQNRQEDRWTKWVLGQETSSSLVPTVQHLKLVKQHYTPLP